MSSAEVLDAAAFLNEGFLREMQKIEGLALAVPGGGRLKESFLAVLLPGASDIMRGVAQMALTKSRARGAGKVADAPLFRLPPDRPGLLPEECIHAALGADIVCFGRPRSLVEDAMKRTASNAPSLAGDRDFQRAQSAREGSLVFTYLRKDAIASALRQSTPLEDRPLLDAALDAWGWGQIHALSLTLSRALSADALRLSLRARRDGAEGGLWNALSTPPIDPDVLRSVPPASLAFFAVRLDRVPDRVELFSSALAPVLDAAPAAGGAAKKDGVEKLREFFEAGAGKAFLEKLDSVVLGLHPVSQEPSALSLFLLLVFTEPSGGPALFEDAFTAFCGSAFGTLAGRKFEPEMLQWNGKQAAVRSIEPIPGHRIRCVQLGKFLAVTASPEILSELEKTLGSKGASPVIPLPSRTAKALFARPAALLSASRKPSGIPPQLEALLSQVERVLLTTREGKESISIDLSIPDVKKTVRSMLSKIAAVKPSGKE